MKIYGVDFTSAPSRKKPITRAECRIEGNTLVLEQVGTLPSFPEFEETLQIPGPWVMGLDFPFGQPRKLIENLGWHRSWPGYVSRLAALSIQDFARLLKEYRDPRPPGDKQHPRAVDRLCGSQSPMTMYMTPVGRMFFRGAPCLLKSGASIHPVHPRRDSRICLEAYPALVARKWIGRQPYKNDNRKKQTSEQRAARSRVIESILSDELPRIYGLRLRLSRELAGALAEEPGADRLDAVLCAIQAAWAARTTNYGVPDSADLLEGWIADPELLSQCPQT